MMYPDVETLAAEQILRNILFDFFKIKRSFHRGYMF